MNFTDKKIIIIKSSAHNENLFTAYFLKLDYEYVQYFMIYI